MCPSVSSQPVPSQAAGGPPLTTHPAVPLHSGRAAAAPVGDSQALTKKTICHCFSCPLTSLLSLSLSLTHTHIHIHAPPSEKDSLAWSMALRPQNVN